MNLDEVLRKDARELRWRCAHEEATGYDLVDVARPGLRLLSAAGEPLVPRPVFHEWMFEGAQRLLKAYVGYGHLEDHEADWLMHGLAMVATTGDWPGENPEQTRALALITLASLSTFSALRQRPNEMGSAYAWARDALTWATKRHLQERRCPHDPVSLAADLRDLHADLARIRGTDETAAREQERRAQVDTFLQAWATTGR